MKKQGIYAKYIKRILDIVCALIFLLTFWWVYIIVAILVRINLGSPVIFKQTRPGLNEELFEMIKFRTMTDEKDEDGEFLPDEVRLTKFGKILRATSLDELPEVYQILTGKLSIVGPRPQLVRDMVFMTKEQRKRHNIRPGLTGLAQVNGRNSITWEEKLTYDLEYMDNISFIEDMKIIFMTVLKVFKREGISEQGMETAEDFGDYLLRMGKIGESEYYDKKNIVNDILDV